MIVITLTACSDNLKGFLSEWLMEIDTGVYVGTLSARVRDLLWNRICSNVKTGRATMVYNSNNEQHLSFRIHNGKFETIDFDGLQFMMHPLSKKAVKQETPFNAHMATVDWQEAYLHPPSKEMPQKSLFKGQSGKKESNYKRKIVTKNRTGFRTLAEMEVDQYTLIDTETTGLNFCNDRIIEIAAVRVRNSAIVDTFQCLINCDKELPDFIINLTGITVDLMSSNGLDEKEAIAGFLRFVGNDIVVGHNVCFDIDMINAACERLNLQSFSPNFIDTKIESRKYFPDQPSYSLQSLICSLEISEKQTHRALEDAKLVHSLMIKLKENRNFGLEK